MGYALPFHILHLQVLIGFATLTDVEIHHLETPHELEFSSIKIGESGPLRASLLGEIKFGKSKVVVDVGRSLTLFRASSSHLSV